MRDRSTIENRSISVIAVLGAVTVAMFGLDIQMEKAQACSFPYFSMECFAPQSLGEISDEPLRPELLAVRADYSRYEEGCGNSGNSCDGSKFSTVTFSFADKQYDDVDDLADLGLLVRTESNSSSSREFLSAFELNADGACESDGAITGNFAEPAFDRDFGQRTREVRFNTANFTSSRFRDVRVSIAFVDQNGNIGPYSEPVELRRQARVIEL